MVGPWLHGPLTSLTGDVDFGFRASDASVLVNEQQLRWFDRWLKDDAPDGDAPGGDAPEGGARADGEPPVRLFVMGENRWRDEPDWPLERARPTPYYLHSGGAANSRHGDGGLTPNKPGGEPVDTYVYDPRNPVPTRGGGLCCWPSALPGGAFDQREIEARPDVLVYTSPVLEQDLEVTGDVTVVLWVATSAPSTDVTAKLVDVGACAGEAASGPCGGFARNLADGILRLAVQPGAAVPQAPARVEIQVGPTSNVFKAGHRIRLEVSSSNFPRFARNPNTGAPIGETAELRPAVQTVIHDEAHPSHVILPVVPRDEAL
jgi:hypothetical protein